MRIACYGQLLCFSIESRRTQREVAVQAMERFRSNVVMRRGSSEYESGVNAFQYQFTDETGGLSTISQTGWPFFDAWAPKKIGLSRMISNCSPEIRRQPGPAGSRTNQFFEPVGTIGTRASGRVAGDCGPGSFSDSPANAESHRELDRVFHTQLTVWFMSDSKRGENAIPGAGDRAGDQAADKPPGRRLALAVDSHGWEDFPAHHTGQPAAELLACWTALWDPAVLDRCRTVPAWQRIDQIPEPAAGAVILVPKFAESLLTGEQQGRLSELGGQYLVGGADRQECVTDILQSIGPAARQPTQRQRRDFYALGYCFLQIQLMTRQLRYVSTLDDSLFQKRLLTAVDALSRAADADCRASLQGCFDQLVEERNRYYPTNASLVDCLYVNEGSSRQALMEALDLSHRFSLQFPGHVARRLGKDRQLGDRLRPRLAAGQVAIVGGPYYELMDALLSSSSMCHQLAASRAAIAKAFPETSVCVFGRRRFGLNTSTPGVIKRAGLHSAIHATLDDGVFPHTAPNNIRWQGDDGTTVDALTAPPRLADSPETWLRLGITIGECIDSSHYASVLFVHWPGQHCDSYLDLVASAEFGDVLGRFVNLNEYFEQVVDPGYAEDYPADQYRNPWLVQLVESAACDPLSRFVEYWKRQTRLLAWQGIEAIRAAWGMDIDAGDPATDPQMDIDLGSERSAPAGSGASPRDQQDGMTRLAQRLLQSPGPPKSGDPETCGTLVINPFSFAQSIPNPLRPGGDVPGMGFVWLPEAAATADPPRKRHGKTVPLVVNETTLRNEFFVLEMNPETGGIGAIQLHNRRGNLIAQQVARRLAGRAVARGGRRSAGTYSQMVAESMEITESGPIAAALQTRGRLVQGTRTIGSFSQTVDVRRGWPVAGLQLQIDLDDEIQGHPWDNYLACRFAWQDETANLFTWLNECRQPTSLNRITAPLVLEIEQAAASNCILTGGLPFHHRIGYRRLDTILITAGETCRQWSLGIGVNVNYPLTAALAHIHPPIQLPHTRRAASAPDAGWLFHLNCKNVVVLQWQCTRPECDVDDGTERPAAWRPSAIRMLVRETEGRSAEVGLDCCRPVKHAFLIDLVGNRLRELEIDNGKVKWQMVARELATVELVW